MPTVTTATASVAYDVTGTGPGLVLVHGTGANRGQWQGLTDAVSDRFTVVAPDMSGSGDTTDDGSPLTLEILAGQVLAAADDAGLTRFHLVGHSLGSAVATHLAATHPDRVASLALHAGWVHTDTRMTAEFRYWIHLLEADAAHGTHLFAEMLPLMAFGPNYWAATDADANAALVKLLADMIDIPGTIRQSEADAGVDLRPLLSSVTAPTLVLASVHDRIIPAAQQQVLLERIARARYAEIDAGHGAPAENPEGFTARLIAFLDEQRES